MREVLNELGLNSIGRRRGSWTSEKDAVGNEYSQGGARRVEAERNHHYLAFRYRK